MNGKTLRERGDAWMGRIMRARRENRDPHPRDAARWMETMVLADPASVDVECGDAAAPLIGTAACLKLIARAIDVGDPIHIRSRGVRIPFRVEKLEAVRVFLDVIDEHLPTLFGDNGVLGASVRLSHIRNHLGEVVSDDDYHFVLRHYAGKMGIDLRDDFWRSLLGAALGRMSLFETVLALLRKEDGDDVARDLLSAFLRLITH